MMVVVRPVLARIHRFVQAKNALDSPYYDSFVFLLLIASAFTTEALGIHAFFGSFLAGIIIPKEGNSNYAMALAGRMETVVSKCCLISS